VADQVERCRPFSGYVSWDRASRYAVHLQRRIQRATTKPGDPFNREGAGLAGLVPAPGAAILGSAAGLLSLKKLAADETRCGGLVLGFAGLSPRPRPRARGGNVSRTCPPIFPRFLGDFPGLFAVEPWGKGECATWKVPVLRGFRGGRDRD
jgi:hypothetical protein